MTATGPERIESAIQILILLLIGGMAGAASFTHVHDWTMRNAPAGTGGWFGWANAVISELTPTAAGLEIRRRKRAHRPIAYPMAVLIAAATLSLAAQVAQARHSFSGWLLAAVPALAFLALSKLVLSRTTTTTTEDQPIPSTENSAPVTAPAGQSDPGSPAEVPRQLLIGARMAAFAHHQATGQPITAETLASQMAIPHTTAGTLLHALDGSPGTNSQPVMNANGTAIGAPSNHHYDRPSS
jgi:hypothetical protein